MVQVTLECGPEGSPNSCFGIYTQDGKCVEFVQSDWSYPDLANMLGAVLPDVEEVGIGDYLVAAYDWLYEHDGEVFSINLH